MRAVFPARQKICGEKAFLRGRQYGILSAMKQQTNKIPCVVDVHTHCFPDALAKKAMPRLSKAAGLPYYANATLGDLRGSMRRSGVDVSVVCNIAVTPSQMHSVNSFAIAIDDWQQGKGVAALGSVHPLAPPSDWEAELERIAEAGLCGIKLHPEYQQTYVDDPRAIRVYQKCVELGLCIQFHSGVDLGIPGDIHCTPERFSHVLQQVDTGRFCLAHLGGYAMYDQAAKYLFGQPVYIDTSFAADELLPEELKQIILGHGAARVLFGSDSPWKDQGVFVRLLRSLELPQETLAAVLGENALRWLNKNVDAKGKESHG